MSNALKSILSFEETQNDLCSLTPTSDGFGVWIQCHHFSGGAFWPSGFCNLSIAGSDPELLKHFKLNTIQSCELYPIFIIFFLHTNYAVERRAHSKSFCGFDLEPLLRKHFGYRFFQKLAKYSYAPFFNSNKNPLKCILVDIFLKCRKENFHCLNDRWECPSTSCIKKL